MSNFSDETDDLNAACAEEFGDPNCIYTPAGSSEGYAITLILQKPLPGDLQFPSAYLKASGVLADFEAAPAKGDRVTIGESGADEYIVFADAHDEEGMVHLGLNKC